MLEANVQLGTTEATPPTSSRGRLSRTQLQTMTTGIAHRSQL